jgi:hypothetical protein
MAKKKVFVSFDWHKDKHYKFLLQAWDANPDFDFVFSDHSSGEIQSDDIPTVKAALTTKVRAATHTLVIVGVDANKQHADHKAIGYRNWQNFEIAKSKPDNKLVGVKLNSNNASPEELLGAGASWAMSFTEDNILKALKDA